MPQTFDSLADPKLTELLRAGAVGVLPTDTVYGLVCIASNQQAVERLYRLKNRVRKPGTLIAASVEQLEAYGLNTTQLAQAQAYWPGAVSVEIEHTTGYLHQGTGRQAFRVPDDETVRDLLRRVGPLQTTSANAPGLPTAATIAEAEAYFQDSVDFYVDGGNRQGRTPSKIIQCKTTGAVEVIRGSNAQG